MHDLPNLYIPVRERIFTLTKSKLISQKEFAKAIKVSPQVVTDWKAGRNFSFMKKLRSIAAVLGTSEVWLLTGKNTAQNAETVQQVEEIANSLGISLLDLIGTDVPKPTATSPSFEIAPELLLSAVEILRDAQCYYEADACALARLDTPEARELAQDRLQSARTAESLLYFFGTQ